MSVLKSYLWMVAGVLSGIVIVSTLRNGEINWILIGITMALLFLAFFAILLMQFQGKRNSFE